MQWIEDFPPFDTPTTPASPSGVTGVVLNRSGLKAWPSSYDHNAIVRNIGSYVNNFFESIYFLFLCLQKHVRGFKLFADSQYKGYVFQGHSHVLGQPRLF